MIMSSLNSSTLLHSHCATVLNSGMALPHGGKHIHGATVQQLPLGGCTEHSGTP